MLFAWLLESECSLPCSQQSVIGSPSRASLIQSASSCSTLLRFLLLPSTLRFSKWFFNRTSSPKVYTHFSYPRVCRLLNSRHPQFDTTILNIMTRQFSPPPIPRYFPLLFKYVHFRSESSVFSENLTLCSATFRHPATVFTIAATLLIA
jgi:hypothetical protein